MPLKIAVIEDDRDLAGLLQYALEQEGFEFACIHDGMSATDFCQRVQPDAIVLDVMLPGLDGFSICRELRRDPSLRDVPVVFLTARTEEADRLRGLEIGGDDYVVKPFSVRELVARLKLRLRSSRALDSISRVGDLELDKDRREGARSRSPPPNSRSWSGCCASRAVCGAARPCFKPSGAWPATSRTAPWTCISVACGARSRTILPIPSTSARSADLAIQFVIQARVHQTLTAMPHRGNATVIR